MKIDAITLSGVTVLSIIVPPLGVLFLIGYIYCWCTGEFEKERAIKEEKLKEETEVKRLTEIFTKKRWRT